MILVTNFKTYPESSGDNAVKLAKIHEEVAGTGKEIIIAVQPSDILGVSSLKIPVFAQHVDPVDPGRNTGFITPESVKQAGAVGVMLNHSEHPMKPWDVEKAIRLCKKAGLKTLVFVSDLSEASDLKGYRPDYLAYEVPELVGSGRPISKEKPEEIQDFVHILEDTKIVPLCGAGISCAEDVKIAKKLGTRGVVVASAITKAKDPKKVIEDLVNI
ncbi:MAG: triosephosphate isomerase [archaeon]|nr:MAG: triosephosphate isomerase [archaeon]